MKNQKLIFVQLFLFGVATSLFAQPLKTDLQKYLSPLKTEQIILQLEDNEYFLSKTISEEFYYGFWEAIDSFEFFYDEEKRLIGKKWWNYYDYPEIGRESYKYSYRFPDSLIIIEREGLFNEWEKIKKTWHFYDDNTDRTKTDITFYESGYIKNLEFFRYSYNELRQLMADTFFVNFGAGKELRELNTYLYNDPGNLIVENNTFYDYYDTVFHRSIYEYDANNNLIRQLDQSADSLDAVNWTLDYTTLWEYDDQNRLVTYLTYGRNSEDPDYVDSTRMTYEYPSPYLTVIISEDLSTFKTFNDLRLQSRYNEYGRNTSNLIEVRLDSIWRELLFDTSTYNEMGFIELYLFKGKPETEWIDFERKKYFYSQLTSLSEPTSSYIHFSIYPNPSDGQITITWPEASNLEGDIFLFDLHGRKVYHQKTWLLNQMDLKLPDRLPDGNYTLKIKDAEHVGAQRILLLKN